MNTTITHTTVPAVTSEITDLVDDLTGFHPALDRAVAALGELAAADLTADQRMNIVAALSGCVDSNLRILTAQVVRHVADPDAHESLAHLDGASAQSLRRLGAEHAAAISAPALDSTAAEMAAVIDNA